MVKCIGMEVYRLSILLDFYGELLTEVQRDILNDYVNDDLTVTEISNLRGTSRQNIHEIVRRSEKILEEYESTLGLLDRFMTAKKEVRSILDLIKSLNIDIKDKEKLVKMIQSILEKF